MSQKVFQALISSDMNVNLWFSVSFWTLPSHLEHYLFIYCSPKSILNDSLSLQTVCVFSGYIEDLFTKKLFLRLPFFIEIWTERAVSKSSFFACHVWNSMKLFSNLQLFVTDHNLCLTHKSLIPVFHYLHLH